MRSVRLKRVQQFSDTATKHFSIRKMFELNGKYVWKPTRLMDGSVATPNFFKPFHAAASGAAVQE